VGGSRKRVGTCPKILTGFFFVTQMQQLESRHKSELANHYRAQDKELEQLRITYDRELEKLRGRLKAEMDQRVTNII
jgi:hypothetical protein